MRHLLRHMRHGRRRLNVDGHHGTLLSKGYLLSLLLLLILVLLLHSRTCRSLKHLGMLWGTTASILQLRWRLLRMKMRHLLTHLLLPPLMDQSLHVSVVAPSGNLSLEEGLQLGAQERSLFRQELHLFLGILPALKDLGVLLLEGLELSLQHLVIHRLSIFGLRCLFH